MELLDGIDLERLVREHGPQPPERVAHLLRQASLSLAEAHARGIVHRDVKPANIFTCRMGLDYDFVKVLDFGLVKLDTEKGSVMDTMRRRVDVTTGTPAYMAPEMAANEPVDHRADLYALGCVGYWLLTGKLVFEAESPLQMLIRHLQAAPVPPSIRLGSPLPSDLEQLVLDCLAKRPDDRPASADAFRRRLDQCRIPDRWTEDRARDWWERYRPPTSAPIPSAPTSEPVDLAVAGG
jgi:serine/threonine-protein kinase